MKKIALLLSLFFVFMCFTACGDGDVSSESTTVVPETSESVPENVVISVNKELVADETAFLTDISEIGGISSTADENFYVLTMSQEVYKKLLTVKSQSVIAEYEALSQKGEYIEDIQYSENFRQVTVLVNREKFDAVDSGTKQIQLITIGAKAMSYQMFLAEGQKTVVSAVYSDTEEVALALSLPIEM
ncbi:MAG: hypothetical protein J6A49_03265 [Clostridia bacterium]|nr:hypothetical protein [Clostridia bacterium]